MLVADLDEVEAVARACREAGVISVAVLNRSLVPARDRVAGVAVGVGAGRGRGVGRAAGDAVDVRAGAPPGPRRCCYLPFGHEDAMSLGLGGGEEGRPANLPPLDSEALEPLRSVLADPEITKVGHDLKRSLIACRRAGVAEPEG